MTLGFRHIWCSDLLNSVQVLDEPEDGSQQLLGRVGIEDVAYGEVDILDLDQL